jgi:subtilisin family serine protease
MKSSRPLSIFFLVLAACGAPSTVATTRPAPTAPPAVAPTPPPAAIAQPTSVPPVTLAEAPRNWQLLDESIDHVPGVSSERAMNELLAGKAPKKRVLVAIIDNGIDTAHVDLRANLWVNPKEVPANHIDDDHNGFVDDMHGWNFIGGRDGQDVHFDTFEVTRQYARCHGGAAASGAPPITDTAECARITAAFEKQRNEIQSSVTNYESALNALQTIKPVLKTAIVADTLLRRNLGRDTLSVDHVRALKPANPQLAQAQQIYLQLAAEGATETVLSDGLKSLQGQLKNGLNPDFNPRTIVGDNYTDWHQHDYGNPDVMGQDAKHGTHVAGIIGAVRGNGIGIDGIAPSVTFMMIRTVPDGDERDKDVANAIRYAVDNGAQIISMSFGKAFSPYKAAVDDAVKYADAHGVLMVHAAGNDGADLSKAPNFPNPTYLDGGHPNLWIEVGASSWKGGEKLPADFSNFGQNQVDLFAPGVDILSTVPGNQYERDSGTSMAAPVVTGVAALVMAYYPNLSAADIRKILLASTQKYPTQLVIRPGQDKDKVPFGTLSVTGGIVNAYNAIRMADDVSNGKAKP